jgi:hypothetical protein
VSADRKSDRNRKNWKETPMIATVLVCGGIFDGTSDELIRPAEILVEGNHITKMDDL